MKYLHLFAAVLTFFIGYGARAGNEHTEDAIVTNQLKTQLQVDAKTVGLRTLFVEYDHRKIVFADLYALDQAYVYHILNEKELEKTIYQAMGDQTKLYFFLKQGSCIVGVTKRALLRKYTKNNQGLDQVYERTNCQIAEFSHFLMTDTAWVQPDYTSKSFRLELLENPSGEEALEKVNFNLRFANQSFQMGLGLDPDKIRGDYEAIGNWVKQMKAKKEVTTLDIDRFNDLFAAFLEHGSRVHQARVDPTDLDGFVEQFRATLKTAFPAGGCTLTSGGFYDNEDGLVVINQLYSTKPLAEIVPVLATAVEQAYDTILQQKFEFDRKKGRPAPCLILFHFQGVREERGFVLTINAGNEVKKELRHYQGNHATLTD